MKNFTLHDTDPILTWLKHNTPLVHCLTNHVSMNFVANSILAVGGSPAIVSAWQEIEKFTKFADNLVVNMGSLTDLRLRGISIGVQTAHKNNKPWVLDPAAVSKKLPYRASFTRELLSYYPAVIRGNAAEILYLSDKKANIRGADSLSRSDDALEAAQALAQKQNAVVVVTGETDYITDGEQTVMVKGGNELLTRVTGTGCALSGIIAATVTSGEIFLGAASACVFMKHAGEYAAKNSKGLGTFATAVLDGLTISR